MSFYRRKPNYDYNNRTNDEAIAKARAAIFAERCRSGVFVLPNQPKSSEQYFKAESNAQHKNNSSQEQE